MMKRIISVLVLLGLVAALFAAQPVKAVNPAVEEWVQAVYYDHAWILCHNQEACLWHFIIVPEVIIDTPQGKAMRVFRCNLFVLAWPYGCTERQIISNVFYDENIDWPAMWWIWRPNDPMWSQSLLMSTDGPYWKYNFGEFAYYWMLDLANKKPSVFWTPRTEVDVNYPPLMSGAYPAPMMGEKQIEPTAPARGKKIKLPAYP